MEAKRLVRAIRDRTILLNTFQSPAWRNLVTLTSMPCRPKPRSTRPPRNAACGWTASRAATEVRIDCPFDCPGDHAGRREVSISTDNPQKVFYCHAYQCQLRGNLLTLMHGWLTGQRPAGDKLKGEEFNRVKRVLADEGSGRFPIRTGHAAPNRYGASTTPPHRAARGQRR